MTQTETRRGPNVTGFTTTSTSSVERWCLFEWGELFIVSFLKISYEYTDYCDPENIIGSDKVWRPIHLRLFFFSRWQILSNSPTANTYGSRRQTCLKIYEDNVQVKYQRDFFFFYYQPLRWPNKILHSHYQKNY